MRLYVLEKWPCQIERDSAVLVAGWTHFYQFSSDQFVAEAIVLHLQQLVGGYQIGQ